MYVFLILALVTLQRAIELVYAHRNASMLLVKGGYEVGRAHYGLMLLLHAAWLAALWWYAWDQPIYWSMIVVYLLLQVVRAWMLMALGPRWTMRIIVTPDEPMEASLFARFLRHPNYLVLALEILVLPLAFGLWWLALLFTIVNAAMIYWRLRIEDETIETPTSPGSIAEL
jgi:methyltransferase